MIDFNDYLKLVDKVSDAEDGLDWDKFEKDNEEHLEVIKRVLKLKERDK